MRHRESPETSVWISNTDMITGVLVIFLFLAVILTHQAEEQKREIEAIAQQSTHAAEELKRNLDEAFTDEEKENDAYAFAKKYKNDGVAFMNYMCESAFSVKGDFKDSWEFIEKDMRSIERYTNLPICLESEMQEKESTDA